MTDLRATLDPEHLDELLLLRSFNKPKGSIALPADPIVDLQSLEVKFDLWYAHAVDCLGRISECFLPCKHCMHCSSRCGVAAKHFVAAQNSGDFGTCSTAEAS